MSTLSPRPFMTERRNSAEDHELSRLDSTASTAPLLEGQGVPRATSPQQSILSARRPKGRRIRRAIYGSFLVFVGITWTIVVIMFERHELQQSKASLNQDVNGEVANGIIAGSIIMRGHLKKYDGDANDLTIEWQLLLDAEQMEYPLNTRLAVYRDVRTLWVQDRSQRAEWAKMLNRTLDDIWTNPQFDIFGVEPPPPPPIGYINHTRQSVVTTISLGQPRDSWVWQFPNWGYPFDRSDGALVLAISNSSTSAQFGQEGLDLLPIHHIQLTESILGYTVTARSDLRCSHDTGRCDTTIDIGVYRPALVRLVVIVVVIVNWFITIAIFFLICESVGLKRWHIIKDSDIISICLTALFALPSVRSILPGAPRFGCLVDLIGILPNIIIISLSTVGLTVAKIRTKS